MLLSGASGKADDTDWAPADSPVMSNTSAAGVRKNRIEVFAQHQFALPVVE
jgi:hypothetical protein